jgi:hypothetical protein
MIPTSGAVAAHQILRMLLVARVAEFDAVGGYSLPPRGDPSWGRVGGGALNRTLSSENQVRSTCARPTLPHPCRGSSRQARSRQQGAAVGYFRSRLLLALPRELRTRIQAAVEHGLLVGQARPKSGRGARPGRKGEGRPSQNAVIAFWKSGAGEGIRILDRNLGKSAEHLAG